MRTINADAALSITGGQLDAAFNRPPVSPLSAKVGRSLSLCLRLRFGTCHMEVHVCRLQISSRELVNRTLVVSSRSAFKPSIAVSCRWFRRRHRWARTSVEGGDWFGRSRPVSNLLLAVGVPTSAARLPTSSSVRSSSDTQMSLSIDDPFDVDAAQSGWHARGARCLHLAAAHGRREPAVRVLIALTRSFLRPDRPHGSASKSRWCPWTIARSAAGWSTSTDLPQE